MKVIKSKRNEFVLRFDRGENYPNVFIKFLKDKKVSGGFFLGLGGFQNPEVAYYDLSKKKYLVRKLRGNFEVLSLVGNAAILDKKLVLHEHVVLGDKSYKTWGGHLVSGRVGGTLEICFERTKALKRQKDFKSGLNLLS